jgi:hypothetical protein
MRNTAYSNKCISGILFSLYKGLRICYSGSEELKICLTMICVVAKRSVVRKPFEGNEVYNILNKFISQNIGVFIVYSNELGSLAQ